MFYKKRIFSLIILVCLVLTQLLPFAYADEVVGITVNTKEVLAAANILSEQAILFEDPSLERAIRAKIDKPAGSIQSIDVKDIQLLDASNEDITSIEGIQYLTGLKTLFLQENNINNIHPLESLTQLETLWIYDNHITDITSIKTLIGLEELDLSINQISDISPLMQLYSIKNLRLSQNLIHDITPLSTLTNLTDLDISKNSITNIDALQSLPCLTSLYLYCNPFSDINSVKKLGSLRDLFLFDHKTTLLLDEDTLYEYDIVFKKARDIINRIIKPDMSDLEKELAIHDYIVTHVRYDDEAYVNYLNDAMPHTAYGALIEGKAVCDGYSRAAQILFNMAGIESMVVTGRAYSLVSSPLGHAWNIVKVDGNYYHVDITTDDSETESSKDNLFHTYFNLSDKQISVTHSWYKYDYPKCSMDSTYYTRIIDESKSIIYTDFYIYKIAGGSLYKIDPNMSVGDKLIDDKVESINLVDDWIYYINISDNNKIYKVKTDGTERKKISNNGAVHLFVDTNAAYYINIDKSKIYKIDINTASSKGKSLNSDDLTTNLTQIGDWLYYRAFNWNSKGKLCKIRTDGTEKITLTNDTPAGFKMQSSRRVNYNYAKYEHIVDDFIYYVNTSDNCLYRAGIDGKNKTKISNDKISDSIFEVFNDFIYYRNADDNKYYMIKIDGSNKKCLE
ncbi:MAG: DUF5050 domain-containing protein [Clostridia bacterium]